MKKKNHIKMRFSTLLLCCLAILLCDAPCGAEIVDNVASGDILNVGTDPDMDVDRIDENDWLYVWGTMNLYPGAYVGCTIYACDGSAVNIYAGELGANCSITLLSINSTPSVVTVYGTGFAVDWDCDGTADPLGPSETEFTPSKIIGSVLEGNYENGYSINLTFLSDVPIHLQPPPSLEEITIDIKPGGNPNNINLKSKGVVPVAVLTTDDFDARTIDPDTDTVLFAGALPERSTLCDVDEDDDLDMLFHFKTEKLVELDVNSTKATLTIETNNGEVISGTDTVCIKPEKKKK